jgi:hypothetical protein
MRAQATRRDQEDRPHPLRRACPDRSHRISQLHQGDGDDGNNNDGGDNGDGDDGGDDGGDPGDDDTFGLHPMCYAPCRHSISELYASVDECFQAMEAMRQRMEDLERVVEDDYKFLNRNVRKIFGMVGNMKGKWCNSCGKYH